MKRTDRNQFETTATHEAMNSRMVERRAVALGMGLVVGAVGGLSLYWDLSQPTPTSPAVGLACDGEPVPSARARVLVRPSLHALHCWRRALRRRGLRIRLIAGCAARESALPRNDASMSGRLRLRQRIVCAPDRWSRGDRAGAKRTRRRFQQRRAAASRARRFRWDGHWRRGTGPWRDRWRGRGPTAGKPGRHGRPPPGPTHRSRSATAAAFRCRSTETSTAMVTAGNLPEHEEFGCALEGYTTVPGDCHDVESSFFDRASQCTLAKRSSSPSATWMKDETGGVSFDFDCSGAEEADPDNSPSGAPPDCASIIAILDCSGQGFRDEGRAGPGIIGQCGSEIHRQLQRAEASLNVWPSKRSSRQATRFLVDRHPRHATAVGRGQRFRGFGLRVTAANDSSQSPGDSRDSRRVSGSRSECPCACSSAQRSPTRAMRSRHRPQREALRRRQPCLDLVPAARRRHRGAGLWPAPHRPRRTWRRGRCGPCRRGCAPRVRP